MEYLKESFKNQSGVLDFSSAVEDTRSGDFTTLSFVYTHLKDTLKISASLELILFPRFPTNAWTLPQITDPTGPGFVTVHTSGARLQDGRGANIASSDTSYRRESVEHYLEHIRLALDGIIAG